MAREWVEIGRSPPSQGNTRSAPHPAHTPGGGRLRRSLTPTPHLPEVSGMFSYPWRLVRASILAGLLLTVGTWSVTAQDTPEKKAAMLLSAARKAYNDKQFPFAVTQFREFLQKYGNHK